MPLNTTLAKATLVCDYEILRRSLGFNVSVASRSSSALLTNNSFRSDRVRPIADRPREYGQ